MIIITFISVDILNVVATSQIKLSQYAYPLEVRDSRIVMGGLVRTAASWILSSRETLMCKNVVTVIGITYLQPTQTLDFPENH
jgi:hypothetical protein